MAYGSRPTVKPTPATMKDRTKSVFQYDRGKILKSTAPAPKGIGSEPKSMRRIAAITFPRGSSPRGGTMHKIFGTIATGGCKEETACLEGQATVDAISNSQKGDEKQTDDSVKKMFKQFPSKEKDEKKGKEESKLNK